MIKKLSVFAVALLGLAALSPAPIKDMEGAKHVLPEQSREQVKEEQKYNGAYPTIGTVIKKTNEDGTGPAAGYPEQDAGAASNVAKAQVVESNPEAIKNISRAEKELKLEGGQSSSPWLTGVIVLIAAFGLFQVARIAMEKYGPAPKRFGSAAK